jgi:XRE family transcriptional regulator, regulator of sulfur utilization
VAAPRSPLAAHFGDNLRSSRNRARISQEELGFRTSLHRTEIGLLERGRREPKLNTVLKLAGALAVPLEELFKGIDWERAGGFKFRSQGDVPVE